MADGRQKTARESALDSVPQEWREDLIERVTQMGGQKPNDVTWYIIQNVINAEAAADRAAAAAEAVSKSVDKLDRSLTQIPEQSAKAVLNAGRSSAEEVQQSIRGVTQEQIDTVNESVAETVQNRLQSGGEHLVEQIGNTLAAAKYNIDQQKQEHIKQLKGDLKDAANEVSKSELRKSWRWSFSTIAGAVLLGVALTAGADAYVWHTAHQQSFEQKIKQISNHCFYWEKHHGYYCRLVKKIHQKNHY